MNFKYFNTHLQKNFKVLAAKSTHLFTVNVDTELLCETYLNSFPSEYNTIFRERRTHDCSNCKNFIRNYGNIVAIIDNKMISIWDFEYDLEYSPSLTAIQNLIHKSKIIEVFVTKETTWGTDKNNELLADGKVITWGIFIFNLKVNLYQHQKIQLKKFKVIIAQIIQHLNLL